MRILMLSIVDPQAALSGAGTVTRNLIHVLQAPPLAASVECLAIPLSVGVAHRVRQTVAIARSLLTSLPAKVAYTYSRAFRSRVLERATAQRYDMALINGSDLLWLEPMLPAEIPRAVVVHNVEYHLFASQVERLRSGAPVIGALLQREFERLKRHECAGLNRAGGAVYLSSVDAELAQADGVMCKSIVVPPLFGERVVRHARPLRTGDRLELGFVGNLHWWPNRRGLSWFLQDVLPRLTRPVHLHVFGHGRIPVRLDRSLLTWHGPIPDISEAWTRCDLMICPMRAGGGVSIKLAEALFHGIPTLATPFATRGLPIGDDGGLVVREEADWCMYLSTLDASAIRQSQISEELSRPFTFDAHRARVHEFMRQVNAHPGAVQ